MRLEEVIHMYLGCQCIMKGDKQSFNKPYESTLTWADLGYKDQVESLILRKLEDMTEEEAAESRELYSRLDAEEKLLGEIEAHRTLWAISKGFDLFGLLDSGQAIDKKTL